MPSTMPTTLRVSCSETTSNVLSMTIETLAGSDVGAHRLALRRAWPCMSGELDRRAGEQRLEERLVAGELRRDHGVGALHGREV